jgi:hypothetical protein
MGADGRKMLIGGLMKHAVPRLVLLTLLAFLAPGGPAMAQTLSKDCLAAIRTANQRHKAEAIPADCWRMGPLRLGMNPIQARTLLGTPGAREDLSVTYRRKKYPVTRFYYAYPRNLKNWLRLAPAQVRDFHPISIRLDFSQNVLVAVSIDNTMRLDRPPCIPSAPGHAFVHRPADFPYGFHGLTLGAKLDDVEASFGKFAASSAGRDFHQYWPVPLSIDGASKVNGVRIASSMPFAADSGIPDYQLTLNPRSCFITGYELKPGH